MSRAIESEVEIIHVRVPVDKCKQLILSRCHIDLNIEISGYVTEPSIHILVFILIGLLLDEKPHGLINVTLSRK